MIDLEKLKIYSKNFLIKDLKWLLVVIAKAFLFTACVVFVVFVSAYYNHSDLHRAFEAAWSGVVPTIRWMLILIFAVLYPQKIYSQTMQRKQQKSTKTKGVRLD